MRTQAGTSSFAPDELDDSDQLIGKPHGRRDDDDAHAEEREERVALRVSPLPLREEEEEELSEADIMEELDTDDLKKMDGPDA